MLRNRGAPPFTIDDALQTAALRALCRSEGFDSLDGMVRWVTVVAWHEVQAEWRRQARVEFGELPEFPDGPDPAQVTENRIVLATLVARIASMTDSEREAITSAVVDEVAHQPIDARSKMRRYRARRRLAALVTVDSQDLTDRGLRQRPGT